MHVHVWYLLSYIATTIVNETCVAKYIAGYGEQ